MHVCWRVNRRILLVYGSTCVQSEYCPKCNTLSWINKGKLKCCGMAVESRPSDDFKIMTQIRIKRKAWPQQLVADLLAKQNGRCFYCGAEFGSWRIVHGKPEPVKMNIDHVVPFTYNGDNTEFVAACSRCNGHKASKYFDSMDALKLFFKQKYAN